MKTIMKRPKINIYPFDGKRVSVVPTEAKLELKGDLEEFVQENWKGKEKWDNAWIPFATSMKTDAHNVIIKAGAMSFKQVNGILRTIEEDKSYAPVGIPNLSLGIIPVTTDGYTIISRRSPKQPHAPGVWNFNGGYMSSRFIDRANCNNPKFASDLRVFSIKDQLSIRAQNQDYQGVSQEEISFSEPSVLAYGLLHSNEMELGVVARIAKTRNDLEKSLRYFEDQNKREHSEVQYLPLEDLPELIKYQANLVGTDPRTYDTKDPRKLLLLDDNLGELIGGVYEKMTGLKLPSDIVPYLNKYGWKIFVNIMSDENFYLFN